MFRLNGFWTWTSAMVVSGGKRGFLALLGVGR